MWMMLGRASYRVRNARIPAVALTVRYSAAIALFAMTTRWHSLPNDAKRYSAKPASFSTSRIVCWVAIRDLLKLAGHSR
jgi:hypothetical protein